MKRFLRQEPLFSAAGALLILHAVLWTVSVVGIAWSRPLVALLWLTAAGFAAWSAAPRLRATFEAPLRSRQSLPMISLTVISLTVGLGAFGAFALAAWLGWSVHPDWVFHWGPKAQRFALAQGIDLEFLARPWNLHAHPDYPTLMPNLTASLALALGAAGVGVTPRLGAIVTILFAALWLAALRALAFRLLAGRGPRWVAEAAWVTAAWSATMFGTGFRQAAGADLPFACAVTLGALALSASKGELVEQARAADLRVAIAAALASQIKFEGTVFALVLVGLWILRRFVDAGPGLRMRRVLPSGLAAGALPGLFVAAWYLWNRQLGLFLPSNAGALDPSRLGAVAEGLFRAASERAWHGLPFTLLALPWFWLRRDLRWPALLLTGQLAAYLGVYLTTPVDLDLLLLTSASRLLYHLVPTLLVLLVVALGSGQPSEATSTLSDDPVSPTFLA